jgi:hypothetical protein
VSLPDIEFIEQVMREGMQIGSAKISVDDKARVLDARRRPWREPIPAPRKAVVA